MLVLFEQILAVLSRDAEPIVADPLTSGSAHFLAFQHMIGL